MAPLRDYLCTYCNHEFTKLVYSRDPDEYGTTECRCGSKAKVLPASIGGVTGVSLSAARPKGRKAGKVFTGNADEPEFTQNGIDGKDTD